MTYCAIHQSVRPWLVLLELLLVTEFPQKALSWAPISRSFHYRSSWDTLSSSLPTHRSRGQGSSRVLYARSKGISSAGDDAEPKQKKTRAAKKTTAKKSGSKTTSPRKKKVTSSDETLVAPPPVTAPPPPTKPMMVAASLDDIPIDRSIPVDPDRPLYYEPRDLPEGILEVLEAEMQTPPGKVLETDEQALKREEITLRLHERSAEDLKLLEEYGELEQDEDEEYINADDPDALDAETLGDWSLRDLKARYDYEWDPLAPESFTNMDPNIRSIQQVKMFGSKLLEANPVDEDGIEIGWDPILGASNPIDTRTIIGCQESYMTDVRTRNESMLVPEFAPDDPEISLNKQVIDVRNSLGIIETTKDPFLPEEIQVPLHVAKWHGYPEVENYEPKNFTNNRFTENPTDFNALSPYRARQLAVEMARSKNAEWLPNGVSQRWHAEQREPYEAYGTLVGTLRKGECDPDIVEQIQPALQIFGNCVELLSIQDGIFRFHYRGLIKNKFGMAAWMQSLLEDAGVEVSNVVFEAGFRKRDPAYDGGDPFHELIF